MLAQGLLAEETAEDLDKNTTAHWHGWMDGIVHLGERWKALNEKQRTPYEAKAAQDKKRYEDEKASYNVSADKPVGVRKRTARGTNRNVAQADAEEEESS